MWLLGAITSVNEHHFFYHILVAAFRGLHCFFVDNKQLNDKGVNLLKEKRSDESGSGNDKPQKPPIVGAGFLRSPTAWRLRLI